MKIPANHINDTDLIKFGEEVINLIRGKEYKELANRFGYALAYGKDPSTVIKNEIDMCLSQLGDYSELTETISKEIIVKYFENNDTGLVAVVECSLSMENSAGEMLVELIVTRKDGENYVTLEQISHAA